MIDEIALLRESNPKLDDDHLAVIRTALEAAIAEECTSPRPGLRRSRRPWLAAAAAAAIVAAAVVVPVAFSAGPSPRRAPHAAETILAQLADVAIDQPATVPPGPGQYQYTASVAANQACGGGPSGTSYCALVPETREIWIGSDGSGRIRETFGTPEFFTTADEAAWKAAGEHPAGNTTSDTSFGPGTLSDGPPNLANVPTDPAALMTAIENRTLEGGPPGTAEDFTQIGDLLRETDASPALRSVLFQVASELPGIVLLGNVSDHGGGAGVGIAMDENGVRNELIFDPATSALIGEQSVALVDSPNGYTGVTAGTALGWTVYDSSGIVNSTDATPTGTAAAAPPVTCTAAPAGTGVIPAPGTSGGGMSAAVHCTGAP